MSFDAGDCPASTPEDALAALMYWWQGGRPLTFNEALGAIRGLEQLAELRAVLTWLLSGGDDFWITEPGAWGCRIDNTPDDVLAAFHKAQETQ